MNGYQRRPSRGLCILASLARYTRVLPYCPFRMRTSRPVIEPVTSSSDTVRAWCVYFSRRGGKNVSVCANIVKGCAWHCLSPALRATNFDKKKTKKLALFSESSKTFSRSSSREMLPKPNQSRIRIFGRSLLEIWHEECNLGT